jgi:hypothetical protein
MQHHTIHKILVTVGVLAGLHCGKSTPRLETRATAATPAADSGSSSAADASDATDAASPARMSLPPMPPSSCGGLVGYSLCDPVTGWPCDVAASETCDFSGATGRFQCFPAPNTAVFCEACGFGRPACGAGFTCNLDDFCERFCCADSDCGIGRCLRDVYGKPDVAAIGYCQEESIVTCLGIADAGPLLTPLDASARP